MQCRGSLVDKQFGSKADRIYCGPCYDAQFASRCDGKYRNTIQIQIQIQYKYNTGATAAATSSRRA